MLQLLLPWADPTAGCLPTGCAPRKTQVAFFSFVVLSLVLLLCCSLIQPAKKHQGFSKKQQRKDLLGLLQDHAAASAPTQHPRDPPARSGWWSHTMLGAFPGTCLEHRGWTLTCGAPPNKVHLTPMSPLRCISLGPAWSEREPVTSLLCPLKVVANLCSSRAFCTLVPGSRETWSHHPQTAEVCAHIKHEQPHSLGSSTST